MAVTTPTNVQTSIPKIWAKGVLRRNKVAGFWGRYVGGEGSGAPIVQKTELLGKSGDQITIQVTDPLAGAGVSGDTAALTGNEENLATSAINTVPLLYRHAVRVNRRANKKSIIDLRDEAEMRLGEWVQDKMDLVRFALFEAAVLPAPLAAETYVPFVRSIGSATGTGGVVNDIIAGETLSVQSLQLAKLDLTNRLAKPLNIDGFPHFVIVAHPNATYQLKQEARYENWVREAQARGANNPFFRGALAVIDGMILQEHPNVTRVTNAGSVKVAKNIAFGREAFVEGLDENTHSESESFDYGLEWGISMEFAFQPRRALELSSMQLLSAAQDV